MMYGPMGGVLAGVTGPARPPRGGRPDRPKVSALLQRREREVQVGVVGIDDALDVLAPDDRRLVPVERDRRRVAGDHLVDLRPRLVARVALEGGGLVHRGVDL